jgi:GTPase SAR1 family protein
MMLNGTIVNPTNDANSSLIPHDSIWYATVRIGLVGDIGVGKTTLGSSVAQQECKEQHSLNEFNIWVLDSLRQSCIDNTICEAVLWDFPGQPDHRLLYSIFLDDLDLALILLDPSIQQEPLKSVKYWVDELSKNRKTPCRTILVGVKSDRGFLATKRNEITAFCQKHAITGGYIETSAFNGNGLENLLARIKEEITLHNITAKVRMDAFERVKEYIGQLTTDRKQEEEQSDTPLLLTTRELCKQLEAFYPQWSISEQEMMATIVNLANLGHIMVVRDLSNQEQILLRPNLLISLAASFLAKARENPNGLGVIEEDFLRAERYNFLELAGSKEIDCAFLLETVRAMYFRHKFCYWEYNESKPLIVFPALIKDSKPSAIVQHTIEYASYVVTGEIENVHAALVVWLGNNDYLGNKYQWQDEAQYEFKNKEICGFRTFQMHKDSAEITLYCGVEVPEHRRSIFQGFVEDALYDHKLSGHKFSWRGYPLESCPRCSCRQLRSEVIKRITEGKEFIFCIDCGKRINLPRKEETVSLSQPDRKANFERALSHIEAVETAPYCYVCYAWGVPKHERWVDVLVNDLTAAGIKVIYDKKDLQIGQSISEFIETIEKSDYVIVVGTPRLLKKYAKKSADYVVTSELRLINTKQMAGQDERETIIPLLLAGTRKTSFPPLLKDSVHIDFRNDDLYYQRLFDLVLKIKSISLDYPNIANLRNSISENVEIVE